MGRKKKKGVVRTKTGRISRAKSAVAARGERDAAMCQPHRRWLPEEKRADQRAATEVGRLYLRGAITEHELEAAEKLQRLMSELRQVMVSPAHARSASSIAVADQVETPAEADHLAPEQPESDEERAERVIRHVNRVVALLAPPRPSLRLAGASPGDTTVMREVERVCVADAPVVDLGALRAGLGALVMFWHLDEGDRRPQIRGFVTERPTIT